jgi:fumarate reductase subunit C
MTEQTLRKPYVRKVPKTWFMQNVRYQKYMIREISVVFLAIYTIILVVGIMRLTQGQAAYEGWLEALKSPVSIIFHIVTLLMVGYHMVTWFAATPKAMPPIRMGGERISAELIVKANYAVWAVVSLFIIILTVL